jgi:hypothetical protein
MGAVTGQTLEWTHGVVEIPRRLKSATSGASFHPSPSALEPLRVAGDSRVVVRLGSLVSLLFFLFFSASFSLPVDKAQTFFFFRVFLLFLTNLITIL